MEKVDLKTKIALYVDNGQFHYMAQALTPSFKKMFYYSRWDCQGYPDPDNRYPGWGFTEITTIDYMFAKDDKIGYDPDKIDLYIFGDLYYYDIQLLLERMGKRVWGMRSAELLEIDRWFFSKKLKELGLPTVRMQHCVGIDELAKILKKSPNTYVKLSKHRGARETFCNEDYEISKNILDKLRFKYGDISKLMEFVVWDNIETEIPEIGWDGYTIDGQYPKTTTFGLELKRKAFLMKIVPYEDLPKPIKTINEKFTPYLRDCKARGIMSTEVRMKSKTLGYYVDFCCFSDDTDVLTDKGWKRFYNLNGTEKICTLNPSNNHIEYHIPTSRISYQYDGYLISISNRSKDLDLLVTPNHSVWVKNRDKKGLISIRADELTGKYYIPRTGIWIGYEPKYFYLPEYHNEWDSGMNNKIHKIKHCEEKPIKIENWLRFLAIYLSDGSHRLKHSYSISITQFARCDEYETILKTLPFEYVKEKNGFSIHDVQLATYLHQFGICNEKYIPDFIKQLSPKLINIFLDTYQIADGYLKNGRRTYYTTSHQLADDIQELVLKSGGLAGIFEKQTKGTPMNVASKGEKIYFRKFNMLNINERNKFTDFYIEGWNNKRCSKYINKVKYSGMVYDVDVKNHIIYIRRNGKSCWSGNCRMPSPPGEIYPNIIENLAEIMWYGAEGIMIEPKYKAKYAGQVNIYSDNLENGDPTQIEFSNDIKDNVKVMFACKIDNKITCIPQGSRFAKMGAIVAIGNTLDEVLDKLDKYSKKVKGFEIEINTTDKVLEEAEKLEQIGIKF